MADNTTAKLAQGTLLQVGDGSGNISIGVLNTESFTAVPGAQRISGPTTRFDLKDVTDHDDLDFFRSYIAGLSDGDMVTVRGNWRPSNDVHQDIREDNMSAARRSFKIVYPDGSPGNTVLFSAFIQETPPTADVGEPLTQELRLKVVGAPYWT